MPLAHTGHVLVDIPLYLGPFLTIAAVLVITDRRRQRREAQEERERSVAAPGD